MGVHSTHSTQNDYLDYLDSQIMLNGVSEGVTQVSVSDFKARCTAILRDLDAQGNRIEVTNRGRVIAVVSAPESAVREDSGDWLGSLRGTVLHYEQPCAPAVDATEWEAERS